MNLHLAGALPRGLPAAVICSPRAGHAVPEVPRSRRPAADGIVKFQTPEIVFGPGALAEAGFAARRIGAQRPFVVTDPGIIEAGWVAELSRYLADVGLAATVWPGITPNPKEKEVAAGYDCYQDLGCDVIIAIGGGSVIDAAKGIAILCGNGGAILDDTRVARTPLAGEAARWQLILDLLDPDKRCGAWSPATVQGRPVVCTRAPHHAREEHANADTGWRWHDDTSAPHP